MVNETNPNDCFATTTWEVKFDIDVCQLCNMNTGVQAYFCCWEKKWQWQRQHAKIQTQTILCTG